MDMFRITNLAEGVSGKVFLLEDKKRDLKKFSAVSEVALAFLKLNSHANSRAVY